MDYTILFKKDILVKTDDNKFILRNNMKITDYFVYKTNVYKLINNCGGVIESELIKNKPINAKQNTELRRKLARKLNDMKRRCFDEKHKDFPYWGKRGIRIYLPWLLNVEEFVKFCIEKGFDGNNTINRIDGEKGYEPDNIDFISMQKNSLWQKGIMHSSHSDIWEAARNTDLRTLDTFKHLIKERIKSGWTKEKIINTPVQKHKITQKWLDYLKRNNFKIYEFRKKQYELENAKVSD